MFHGCFRNEEHDNGNDEIFKNSTFCHWDVVLFLIFQSELNQVLVHLWSVDDDPLILAGINGSSFAALRHLD